MIKYIVAFLIGVASTASAFSLGPISLSPTAAPLVVSIEPLVSLTSFKAGAGAVLTNESDVAGGMEFLGNWGPYHFGIAAGLDYDSTDSVKYGCAGLVIGVRGYGDAAILWRNAGALIGYAIPFGVGLK